MHKIFWFLIIFLTITLAPRSTFCATAAATALVDPKVSTSDIPHENCVAGDDLDKADTKIFVEKIAESLRHLETVDARTRLNGVFQRLRFSTVTLVTYTSSAAVMTCLVGNLDLPETYVRGFAYGTMSAFFRFFESEIQSLTSGSWLWPFKRFLSKPRNKKAFEMVAAVIGMAATVFVESVYVKGAEESIRFLIPQEGISTDTGMQIALASSSYLLISSAISLQTKKNVEVVARSANAASPSALMQKLQTRGNWIMFGVSYVHTLTNAVYQVTPSLSAGVFAVLGGWGGYRLYRFFRTSDDDHLENLENYLKRDERTLASCLRFFTKS